MVRHNFVCEDTLPSPSYWTQGKDSPSEWRRPFIPSNAPAANLQTTPPHPPLVVDADADISATSVHYLPAKFLTPSFDCRT